MIIRLVIAAALSIGAASAADFDLWKTLHGIENRYNNSKTLQAKFTETQATPGRPKIQEKGTLYVQKPGKTRWQYDAPVGKVWVSDGKMTYDYDPDQKTVTQESMKGTEDVRAPLAFILGKIDFEKDFGQFETSPQPDGTVKITAKPKSDKFPFSEVSFIPRLDSSLQQVSVKLSAGTVLNYAFDNETRNVALDGSLFQFKRPPGVTVVDNSH